VLDNLAGGMVLTRSKLRDRLAVKNERLGEVLESLERAGRLSRTAAGWQRLDRLRGGVVPVPPFRDKWERNGVDGLCRVRGALGYVRPADNVAGLGARILAECDRLLREARASRAVGQSRGARGWVKGTTASD
jgi:hypothetical protein